MKRLDSSAITFPQEKKKKRDTIYCISCLFAFSLIVLSKQLLNGGYFATVEEDTYAYTSWAWQFVEALREGEMYPRWLALDFWGYGSPTFLLYSPLAFYVVAFFSLFTSSIIVAMNLAKFTTLFISAVGLFFLVREFYPERTAMLTAAFYIILPYTVFEIYIAGNFASLISLLWIPPILLFIYKYFQLGGRRSILYAGVCYGGLILTHLIIAYMVTFAMMIFAVYLSIIQRKPKKVFAMSLVLFVGIAVSSAYIIPLLFERQFTNLSSFTKYSYADYFILPKMTYKSPANSFWPFYYKEFVIHLLIFTVLSLLAFFKTVKMRSKSVTREVNIFFLIIASIAIFLLFGPSAFLWETIPYFNYIQFPFRWFNVAGFAVVFLSAPIFKALEIDSTSHHGYKFLILLLFLLFLFLDYRYISSAPIFTKEELLPAKSVTWTPEHLPVQVDMGTIDKKEAPENERVLIIGKGKVDVLFWKSAERVIKVAADQPLILRVRTFNFPGWTAYINNNKAKIKTEGGTGAILVDIPAGRHTLVLRFLDTPIRYYSKMISIITLLTLICLVIPQRG